MTDQIIWVYVVTWYSHFTRLVQVCNNLIVWPQNDTATHCLHHDTVSRPYLISGKQVHKRHLHGRWVADAEQDLHGWLSVLRKWQTKLDKSVTGQNLIIHNSASHHIKYWMNNSIHNSAWYLNILNIALSEQLAHNSQQCLISKHIKYWVNIQLLLSISIPNTKM